MNPVDPVAVDALYCLSDLVALVDDACLINAANRHHHSPRVSWSLSSLILVDDNFGKISFVVVPPEREHDAVRSRQNQMDPFGFCRKI